MCVITFNTNRDRCIDVHGGSCMQWQFGVCAQAYHSPIMVRTNSCTDLNHSAVYWSITNLLIGRNIISYELIGIMVQQQVHCRTVGYPFQKNLKYQSLQNPMFQLMPPGAYCNYFCHVEVHRSSCSFILYLQLRFSFVNSKLAYNDHARSGLLWFLGFTTPFVGVCWYNTTLRAT